MFEHLSTRARIFWLVIASALPLVVLSVYTALAQRDAEVARATDEVRHHAHLVWVALEARHVGELPMLNGLTLGQGETLELVDPDGHVIARYPADRAAVGEDYAHRRVLDATTGWPEMVFEQPDFRNVPRLYAFKTAAMNADREYPVRIFVSVPLRAIHQESNRLLLWDLLGIGTVTLLLMISAWVGAERLILQPIRTLLDMTGKVRAGDLGARTGMSRGREELAQLGSALDEMAGQLQARDAKLHRVLEELRTQAVTDPLTRLYNRRYLWDALRRELIAARRKQTVVSVILIDLDNFKHVNDVWGHDAGDRVLEQTADLLRTHVRGSDIAVRYGGEEFALLLPDTRASIAQERAESLRRELEAREIAYDGNTIRITLSCGVAECDGGVDEVTLMRHADQALYDAKRTGRNKVVMHGGVDAYVLKPDLRAHA